MAKQNNKQQSQQKSQTKQNNKQQEQKGKQQLQPKKSSGSNFVKRTVAALIMSLVCVGAVYFDKVAQLMITIQLLMCFECTYDIFQIQSKQLSQQHGIKEKLYIFYQTLISGAFITLTFVYGSPEFKFTTNQALYIQIALLILLIMLCHSYTQANSAIDGQQIVATLVSTLVIYLSHSGVKLMKSNCTGPMIISTLLVIINDVFAYLCGSLWCKIVKNPARLIRVSKSKTIAGFIGAAVFTVLLCKPVEMLVQLKYKTILTKTRLFIFACCCAVLCPVGGFIGSTIKRSVGLKDFGFILGSHGGIIDRMDCQWLMYWLMATVLKCKFDFLEPPKKQD